MSGVPAVEVWGGGGGVEGRGSNGDGTSLGESVDPVVWTAWRGTGGRPRGDFDKLSPNSKKYSR